MAYTRTRSYAAMLSRLTTVVSDSVVGRSILTCLRGSYMALSRKQKIWLAISVLYVLKWANSADTPRVIASNSEMNNRILALLKHILSKRYRPSFYAPNSHLNSLVVLVKPAPKIDYAREIIQAKDGGISALEWVESEVPLSEEMPTLLLIHGINGNRDEPYIRWAAKCGILRQWRVVCLTMRGCGGLKISVGLASAACTDDIRMAVELVVKRYPESPLFTVGFSLGANILVKYLAEETRTGHVCPVTAACSIGNPWNLSPGFGRIYKLERFFGHMYEKMIASGLVSKLREHMKESPAFFHKRESKFNFKEGLRSRDIFEFDKHVMVPLANGEWKDVHDYRQQSSSASYLPDVRVPLLCLNAEDDPVVRPISWPLDAVRKNPSTIFVSTKTGGHLGWSVGLNPFQPNWADGVYPAFFEAVLQAQKEHLLQHNPPSESSNSRTQSKL